jgi:hypothetical protein
MAPLLVFTEEEDFWRTEGIDKDFFNGWRQ